MNYDWFLALVTLSLALISFVQPTKDRLRFVILGDIGGVPWRPYSLWSQILVSKKIAKIPYVDFFVSAGDNFYYRGVKRVDDFRFFATFEKVYSYPSLQKNWYMVAGNHDHYGNVSAQISYTQKSKRWIFPHFYHTKVFDIPKSNKSLQIVMIDTMSLCHSLPKYKNAPLSETQMEWITNTLENSKADYLVVVGHHPIYSAGKHGSTQCLQDKLLDLLKQHRVNAYISGHDHNLQHIVPENSSLEHFVCGAANFHDNLTLNIATLEPNSLKVFMGENPGFLLVTARDEKLKFEFRTIRPRQKYKTFLPPRQELPEYVQQKSVPKFLEDFLRIQQGNNGL